MIGIAPWVYPNIAPNHCAVVLTRRNGLRIPPKTLRFTSTRKFLFHVMLTTMRQPDYLLSYILFPLILNMTVLGVSQTSIQMSDQYPQYWAYKGKPVLLLGGTVEDNLFQIPDLEAHVDLLKSVGGNYVRNTMSSRDSGNVWAFYFDEKEGVYDLSKWNDEYWQRFENFLKLTAERDIIVQIEVWATFDFYRDNWTVNPFNPKNNRNYTAERTKLPEEVKTHPTRTDNPFFWSVPSQHHNIPVLQFQ